MDEAARSAWCREHGVFPSRPGAVAGQARRRRWPRPGRRAQPRRRSEDRRRIKELERELQRKDKALAETAALLVLSKKLEAIFHKARTNDRPGRSPDPGPTTSQRPTPDGARLHAACEMAGIDLRTLQRWKAARVSTRAIGGRKRCGPSPAHALTEDERDASC